MGDDLLPPISVRSTILSLDLTENSLTGQNDLKFLLDFVNLRTLILDKNQIQSNIRLPLMLSLTTLWCNHNRIENLAVFVQNVAQACPNLSFLSMMNNKAAPSYFNGGTLAEYNDYRLYVISRLTRLTMLDDKEITDEERAHAKSVYGSSVVVSTSRRKSSVSNNKLSRSSSVFELKTKNKSMSKRRATTIDERVNDEPTEPHETVEAKEIVEEETNQDVGLSLLPDLNVHEANNELAEEHTDIEDNELDLPDSIDRSQIDKSVEQLPPPSPSFSILVDYSELPDLVDQNV